MIFILFLFQVSNNFSLEILIEILPLTTPMRSLNILKKYFLKLTTAHSGIQMLYSQYDDFVVFHTWPFHILSFGDENFYLFLKHFTVNFYQSDLKPGLFILGSVQLWIIQDSSVVWFMEDLCGKLIHCLFLECLLHAELTTATVCKEH